MEVVSNSRIIVKAFSQTFENVFSAMNVCRLDDLILADTFIEYPKIGSILRADDVILVKTLVLKNRVKNCLCLCNAPN